MSNNIVKIIVFSYRKNGVGTNCHSCEKVIESFPYIRRFCTRRRFVSPTVYYHLECGVQKLLISQEEMDLAKEEYAFRFPPEMEVIG